MNQHNTAPLSESVTPEWHSETVTVPAATATLDAAVEVNLTPDTSGGGALVLTDVFAQGVLSTDLTIIVDGDSHRRVVLPLPPSLAAHDLEIRGSLSQGLQIVLRNRRQSAVPVTMWYRGRAKVSTATLPSEAVGAVLPDAGARPVYYDRPGTPQLLSYEGDAVAPHGQTTRATYTVPTGYRAFLEFATLTIIRASAAGTLGNLYVDYAYQPQGAGVQGRIVRIQFNDNTVGAHAEQTQASAGVADAGDILRIITQDGNTGGTISHRHYAKILPFVK